MMKTVKFKNLQYFEGRNGVFKCSGVELFLLSDIALEIVPITSKGKLGRCCIHIDSKSIKEFIKSVTELANIDILCGDDLTQYKRESIKWSVEDFTSYKQEGWQITDQQAQTALEDMTHHHDCEYGINWQSVQYFLCIHGEKAEVGKELWRNNNNQIN